MDLNDRLMQMNRDALQKMDEDARNRERVQAIKQVGFEQSKANSLLQSQINELREQNKLLNDSLKESKKSEKFSRIISVITASTAVLSLIATIIIALAN